MFGFGSNDPNDGGVLEVFITTTKDTDVNFSYTHDGSVKVRCGVSGKFLVISGSSFENHWRSSCFTCVGSLSQQFAFSMVYSLSHGVGTLGEPLLQYITS